MDEVQLDLESSTVFYIWWGDGDPYAEKLRAAGCRDSYLHSAQQAFPRESWLTLSSDFRGELLVRQSCLTLSSSIPATPNSNSMLLLLVRSEAFRPLSALSKDINGTKPLKSRWTHAQQHFWKVTARVPKAHLSHLFDNPNFKKHL